jgi:ubiquitin-like modifier-activating enzyme ATG7
VTRPGLAPIAAGLAVELLVSLLHHPAGLHAPADTAPGGAAFPAGATAQPLGLVPHQVHPRLPIRATRGRGLFSNGDGEVCTCC